MVTESDPKLPEGIRGIIKNATVYPSGSISGEVWYDSRFPNGYNINCFDAVKIEDGIYETPLGSRYMVEVMHE